MKKLYLKLFLSVATAAVVLASCVKTEDISNLLSLIDALKTTEIASIDKQIVGIKSSIENLEKMDETLKVIS